MGAPPLELELELLDELELLEELELEELELEVLELDELEEFDELELEEVLELPLDEPVPVVPPQLINAMHSIDAALILRVGCKAVFSLCNINGCSFIIITIFKRLRNAYSSGG